MCVGLVGVKGLSASLSDLPEGSWLIHSVLANPQRGVPRATIARSHSRQFLTRKGVLPIWDVSCVSAVQSCASPLAVGLIMSDDDERYRGCQAPERDSRTKAKPGVLTLPNGDNKYE